MRPPFLSAQALPHFMGNSVGTQQAFLDDVVWRSTRPRRFDPHAAGIQNGGITEEPGRGDAEHQESARRLVSQAAGAREARPPLSRPGRSFCRSFVRPPPVRGPSSRRLSRRWKFWWYRIAPATACWRSGTRRC